MKGVIGVDALVRGELDSMKNRDPSVFQGERHRFQKGLLGTRHIVNKDFGQEVVKAVRDKLMSRHMGAQEVGRAIVMEENLLGSLLLRKTRELRLYRSYLERESLVG